jgi:hypothetical protein
MVKAGSNQSKSAIFSNSTKDSKAEISIAEDHTDE